MLEAAGDRCPIVGLGGDELLTPQQWGPLHDLLDRRRRPQRRDVVRLAASVVPRPIRGLLRSSCAKELEHMSWLRPEARRRLDRESRRRFEEPVLWSSAIRHVAARRDVILPFRAMQRLARAGRHRVEAPLLDLGFVDAFARAGGCGGWGGRTATMDALARDLLPADVVRRSSKAYFNHVFFGEESRSPHGLEGGSTRRWSIPRHFGASGCRRSPTSGRRCSFRAPGWRIKTSNGPRQIGSSLSSRRRAHDRRGHVRLSPVGLGGPRVAWRERSDALAGDRVHARRTPHAPELSLDLPGLELRVREDIAHSELVHPLLGRVASHVALAHGLDGMHAGAVLGRAGASAVIGPKGAGKSTLLASLSDIGASIVTHDVLVFRSGAVMAGPRCIDLRPDTRRFGLGVAVRPEDPRNRISRPPIPAEHPFAGLIHLEWSPGDPTIEPLDHRGALKRLLVLQGEKGYPRDPRALLELAALPNVVLTRPRAMNALDDALAEVERVLAEAGAAYGGKRAGSRDGW